MSKAKVTTSTQIDVSKLKRHGKISPEELCAWMLHAGFPAKAQVLAEGCGTVYGESGFDTEAMTNPEYRGLWQENSSYGSVAERTDAKTSCELAYGGWKPTESFDEQWGQYDNYAGKTHAPEYIQTAEHVIQKGVTGTAEGTAGNTTEAEGEVGGSVNLASVEAAAKAAAFSTYLELPGVFDQAESYALRGQRSLMNDEPLLPFIQQLTKSSLRRFQSLPNGNFYAFYPDYFGGLGKTPYWEIMDIEIMNGEIQLSDEALATHVYVVGDNSGFMDGVTMIDKAASAGVVTIFHAMMSNFIEGYKNEPKETTPKESKKKRKEQAAKTKAEALSFLKKYGARPYYEEAPMVRSPYFEMFLAFQQFCLLWSKQFLTKFELTYMPELFPGGLVALPEHGLQLFIEEVQHEWDYESGFKTNVQFSAPASLENGPVGLSDGMIRTHALTDT